VSPGASISDKHGAKCAMGKVGGDKKTQGVEMYYYKFAVID